MRFNQSLNVDFGDIISTFRAPKQLESFSTTGFDARNKCRRDAKFKFCIHRARLAEI